MFSMRPFISLIRLRQESVRGAVLHASTLAVFLIAVIGQGFSPCPHHAGLDTQGPVHGAVSTETIPGGMGHGTSSPADSEREDHHGVCSCLVVCDTESGQSLPSGQSHHRPTLATAVPVAEKPAASLLDTRQNAYVVPLPQPPPNSPRQLS